METAAALAVIGYVVLCLAVGVCGHYRRSGFLLTVLLAVVLTPPVVLAALHFFAPRNPTPQRPR